MTGTFTRVLALAALSVAPAAAQPQAGSPLPGQKAPDGGRHPAPAQLPRVIGPAGLALPAPLASPAPPPAAVTLPREEKLTRFDPQAVELKWNEGHWLLSAGGTVLKDFGPREGDARQAWHLIRELRLNQHGTVGAPQPIMEYWLSDGSPPRSLPRGVRTLALDPGAIKAEKSQGFWVLRESNRVLFNFGPREREAEQAVAVLRKYGFNQVGIVGRAAPSMLIFAARSEPGAPRWSSPDSPADPAERHGRRQATAKQLENKKEKNTPASFYPTPAVPALRTDGMKGAPFAGRIDSPGLLTRRPPAGAGEAPPDVHTDRVPFDWRQAKVRRDDGEWKLVAGSNVLASFGGNERDARLAHAALMHYRLTEQHLVGGPEPIAGYFLSSGQAPRGMMVGLMGDRFRPEDLSVRQVGESYCVAEHGRPVLDCGPREDAARYMLHVIRRHQFNSVYRIGRDPQQSLTFFAKSH